MLIGGRRGCSVPNGARRWTPSRYGASSPGVVTEEVGCFALTVRGMDMSDAVVGVIVGISAVQVPLPTHAD